MAGDITKKAAAAEIEKNNDKHIFLNKNPKSLTAIRYQVFIDSNPTRPNKLSGRGTCPGPARFIKNRGLGSGTWAAWSMFNMKNALCTNLILNVQQIVLEAENSKSKMEKNYRYYI